MTARVSRGSQIESVYHYVLVSSIRKYSVVCTWQLYKTTQGSLSDTRGCFQPMSRSSLLSLAAPAHRLWPESRSVVTSPGMCCVLFSLLVWSVAMAAAGATVTGSARCRCQGPIGVRRIIQEVTVFSHSEEVQWDNSWKRWKSAVVESKGNPAVTASCPVSLSVVYL